jgi:RNA polymerase sigma-70 factor, ECF subfamily
VNISEFEIDVSTLGAERSVRSRVNSPRNLADTDVPILAKRISELSGTARTSEPEPIAEIKAEVAIETEEELMQRFQAGDEQAFLEIYKRRRAQIFTFCVHMCAGDEELAKDAFQETFIRIHSRRDQYRGENFPSWCRSIARSISIDLQRKRKPRRFKESDYEIPANDRSAHPDDAVEQHILRARIDRALARVPLKLRECFVLHDYEGMTMLEIATELEISEDAVRVRVWRARKQLRKLLLPVHLP